MKARKNVNAVWFWCPGCDEAHRIVVAPAPNAWGFNENLEAPTITPSVLCHSRRGEPPVTSENIEEWRKNPWPQEIVDHVCHSFVTDGRIAFLADSTHALANQTVDLPDWPDDVM